MAEEDGGLQALHVAIAAGVLLVAVVAVDVAFNTSIRLDVQTGMENQTGVDAEGWETIASLPGQQYSFAPHGVVVETNRSEDVSFRLVIDNDRPIGFEESYEVRTGGQRVARGTLAAERMSTVEERFTIPASQLLGEQPSGGPEDPRRSGVGLELVVGEDGVHAWVELMEVAR